MSGKIQMTARLAIELPLAPNYLMLHREHQDQREENVPVSAFSHEELRLLAEAWGEAMIANAERQRGEEAEGD